MNDGKSASIRLDPDSAFPGISAGIEQTANVEVQTRSINSLTTTANPAQGRGSCSPQGQRFSAVHLPGFDGLRGLAILSVVVFHTLGGAPHATLLDGYVLKLASLGWMGVDFFFVLSGFLITGILIDQRDSPRYFRTFFGRRALRIIPVYVVFLFFWMWVAPLVGAIALTTAEKLRAVQGWYWTYLVNIFLVLHGWAAGADGPTHLWSLAVEEQFYLLWPFVVRVLSPKALPRAALACIIGAEACRILVNAAGGPPQTNYLLLPTRMDTLAVGAFLACAVRNPILLSSVERWCVPIVALAIVSLLAAAGMARSLDFEHPVTQLVAYPAIAMLGGGLVFSLSQSSQLLSSSVLRFLGHYSYGIYIWHWLVLRIINRHPISLPLGLDTGSYLPFYCASISIVLAGSVAIALISWHALEKPFLRLKRFIPRETG